MPRQARIDAPNLLQHIMARGIERRKIFKDEKDYQSFLGRLAIVLEETQTRCYAWALLPNHFHLLIRTGPTSLSKVMRRLMTGYAVSYNNRYKRSGHLFQNRYRSVVCQEDGYLLEMIRYIHLNPIRLGIVKDLKELDGYSWTGHSALLGKKKNPLCIDPTVHKDSEEKFLSEKTVAEVLYLFGNSSGEGKRKYRQFVKRAVGQGNRPDLLKGGMPERKSGKRFMVREEKMDNIKMYDQRVLGSADFTAYVLLEAEKPQVKSLANNISLQELIKRVSNDIGVDTKILTSSKRDRKVSLARSVISYLAAIELRYKNAKIAKALRLSEKSVSRCVERGRKLLEKDKRMLDYLE